MRGFRRRRDGPTSGVSCRELVELVTDYFEGALASRDRRKLEEHISTCEGCTAYLGRLRVVRSALRGLAEEQV